MPATAPPKSKASSSKNDKLDNKIKKPKRPLSGYNLFYRYKRNKVLEATAGEKNGKGNGTSSSSNKSNDENDDAKIRAIITSLAGLENIPPAHPLWSLPPHAINEIRGTNIRREMEGKLFPNENARNRLHRKVHGMGFVEMGSLMRGMWARVDDYTKEVFGELADVGRVRYRRLLAEFKLKENGSLKSSSETIVAAAASSNFAVAGKPQDKNKKMNKRTLSSSPIDAVIVGAESFASSSISIAEVTPKPAKKKVNLPAVGSFAFPTMPATQPVLSSSISGIMPLSFGSSQMPLAQGDTNYLASLSTASLEPLSVSTNFGGPARKAPKYNRRVSNDSLCGSVESLCGPVPPRTLSPHIPSETSTPISHLSALYQAHSQVANEYRALVLKNCLPPPPLFRSSPEDDTINNNVGPGSSTMGCTDTASVDQPEASAQDFIELIGHLSDDKAIVENKKNEENMSWMDILTDKKTARRPSLIFGKPMHDIAQKEMGMEALGKMGMDTMGMNPIPNPYGLELNNPRARMA